ncbi:MAG: hypothetical protein ABIU20_01710 [Blastocatellia bacterium]
MIGHFDHKFAHARYWIEEKDIREAFLLKRIKRIAGLTSVPSDLKNDYETYRIAIRKIARNTDTRTLITTIIPPFSFAGNSLSVHFPFHHNLDRYNELRFTSAELLAITALLNSFAADFALRAKMSANLNIFFLYQLSVPCITEKDSHFALIVTRAAKLICTTPEFDDLAGEVGLGDHTHGITDKAERARLRAELDGLVAHLYELTEEEFGYILTTFPLVSQEAKDAAMTAYRAFGPQL